jgi:hypothetical protein
VLLEGKGEQSGKLAVHVSCRDAEVLVSIRHHHLQGEKPATEMRRSGSFTLTWAASVI